MSPHAGIARRKGGHAFWRLLRHLRPNGEQVFSGWQLFMNLTLRIPDEIAARLAANGADLERRELEILALETFRAGHLTREEFAQLLRLEGRGQLDGFLKARGVFEPGTVDDIERDAATLARLGIRARVAASSRTPDHCV